jgi:hypothetical protein
LKITLFKETNTFILLTSSIEKLSVGFAADVAATNATKTNKRMFGFGKGLSDEIITKQ